MMVNDTSIGLKEQRVYLLVALLAFGYVLLRAMLVPWVNDEALTFWYYVEPNDYLPFHAHWDANNHFLNTWLMSLSYERFGLSHLGSRYGNVLAFALYAWAGYQLGGHVRHGFVRWCLWLALLLCPMLIELFGFARGYGMATACWLAAVVWLMRLVRSARLRALVMALSMLLLANAAVLVAVPVWVAALVSALVLWVRRANGLKRWMGLLAWLVLGALPLAVAMKYSLELRERGGLFIGGAEGFVPVTVASLLKQLVGSDGITLAWGVTMTMASAAAVLLVRRWRERELLVPAALLGADVISRLLMAWLMEVNYPIDRAVAHLVPWALVVYVFAVDSLSTWRNAFVYATAPLLWLSVWTLVNARLDSSMLWGHQSPPERLVRRVAEKQADGLGLVGGPPHLDASIALEARRLGLEAMRIEADHPNSPWLEHRIVMGRKAALDAAGYRVVDSIPSSGHYLLERDPPSRMVVDYRRTTGSWQGPEEFMEVLNSDTLIDGLERVIDIEGPIDAQGEYMDMTVNVTMQDAVGADVYYERSSVSLLRPRWHGEQLRLRFRLPAIANAVNRKIYIWNINKKPLRAGPFNVALRRLE